MIRHIVLMKARPGVTEAEIAAIFADLAAIKAKLPGILAIHAGRSESPEQMERGYMHGFTVDFADWASLAAYQDHPDHKRVGAALVAAAEGGLDGLLVFDLPTGSPR
ncbi:Dabb family protein [Tabrizicola sp.]|uniref:Dabb family protein n=1 Tax=Tabrizicola sp. TaxID=2005166 RepID=UPI0026269DB3|nr:Dabb family protein [Tabrizicola sp.]MDM7930367.1 Dabb family protein [Tabrizicola sp.]